MPDREPAAATLCAVSVAVAPAVITRPEERLPNRPSTTPLEETLSGVSVEATGDEARWAEAQSLLECAPTETAEQRLRRWRWQRVPVLAAALLVPAAVAAALVVLTDGVDSAPSEVPMWQAVIGFAIATAGLALQLFGVVAAWRANRRLRAWSSPLAVLTSAQRRQLRAQIRGRQPVDPARLPLAQLQAEQVLSQRTGMVANLGLETGFVGLWIATPSTLRAALAVGYGLLLAILWPIMSRDTRPARRFLTEHRPAG